MIESNFDNDVKLEILISTMNKTSLSFLESMFPHHILENLHILIINQTIRGKDLSSNKDNIRVINSYEKGLSRSRNLAIKNVIGEICLLADDDVEYLPNFETIVKSSFISLKDASVIRFKIKTFCGKPYKEYFKISKLLTTKKDVKRTSSIEIAFKRKDIVENNILFNTLFGLGSHFKSGEEYLFLKDILNKGLQVYFENKAIVKHSYESSTRDIASDNYIKTKAVLHFIDYNFFGYLVLFKFIIFLVNNKSIKLMQIFSKYIIGHNGIKDYKKLIKEDV